ncbi:MAG: methyltransferase domain-containing protein [Candidatus Hydrogenedentes bacterium]|nr:methyltransferase domain-containing protein [Candidatus Hydrogenedentota bacterium]
MERKTFDKFRSLIYQKCGIALGDQKEALVSARIAKRMCALNIESQEAYYNAVVKDTTGAELVRFIDAISTNYTSFFREPIHFDMLTRMLAAWKAQGQRRFRIWCAAASTGEEPYTLAITVNEAIGSLGVDVKILATDISTRVLQKCQEGRYDGNRMSGVRHDLRHKYFEEVRENGQAVFEARDTLRTLLVFRRLNLSAPPFPMRGPFDAVFCRNVMIYFDSDVRTRLVSEIHRLLKPGGYLMVGHAESLTGLDTGFRPVRPSVYVK